MNGNPAGPACPRCGSPASVHSIQELAALARMQLGNLQPGSLGAVPGYPGNQQPGAVPGYLQEPRPGPHPTPGGRRGGGFSSGSRYDSPGDDLAGLAVSEAARFIGRRLGRRMQRAVTEQALPALAARSEQMLRTQIAIADRYPDICACLDDQVIFLAGGGRTLPMPDLSKLTMEQADAIVARLQATA